MVTGSRLMIAQDPEWDSREKRKISKKGILVVMDKFTVSITVMVSGLHTHIKTLGIVI